jgi:hypothetical protein
LQIKHKESETPISFAKNVGILAVKIVRMPQFCKDAVLFQEQF